MKARFAICLVLLTHFTHVYSQNASPKQDAENIILKIKQYEQEFAKLDAKYIFNELERLRSIIAIKNQGSALPNLEDEDTIKATAYAITLEAKRKLNEPSAAYYWGIYNSRICSALNANKNAGAAATKCWADTLESFKIASEGGIPRASFNIGLIYENGWGVTNSKYLAAEWYVKAAERYNINGDREGTLESIESALRVVPDYPAALRLRAKLFK